MASKAPKEKKLKMDRRNVKERERIQKQSAAIKRIGVLVGAEEGSSQQKIMDTAKAEITLLNVEEKRMQQEIMEMDQTILLLQQKLAFLEADLAVPFLSPPVGLQMYGGFAPPQQSFDSPGRLHQGEMSSSCSYDYHEEFLEEESDQFLAGSSDAFVLEEHADLNVDQTFSSEMLAPVQQGSQVSHQQFGPQPPHVSRPQFSEAQQLGNSLCQPF